jgi:hypothetical protein
MVPAHTTLKPYHPTKHNLIRGLKGSMVTGCYRQVGQPQGRYLQPPPGTLPQEAWLLKIYSVPILSHATSFKRAERDRFGSFEDGGMSSVSGINSEGELQGLDWQTRLSTRSLARERWTDRSHCRTRYNSCYLLRLGHSGRPLPANSHLVIFCVCFLQHLFFA